MNNVKESIGVDFLFIRMPCPLVDNGNDNSSNCNLFSSFLLRCLQSHYNLHGFVLCEKKWSNKQTGLKA